MKREHWKLKVTTGKLKEDAATWRHTKNTVTFARDGLYSLHIYIWNMKYIFLVLVTLPKTNMSITWVSGAKRPFSVCKFTKWWTQKANKEQSAFQEQRCNSDLDAPSLARSTCLWKWQCHMTKSSFKGNSLLSKATRTSSDHQTWDKMTQNTLSRSYHRGCFWVGISFYSF